MNSLFKSFKDLDIRVGTIIDAERFDEAIKPSYKLKIDFGQLGILKEDWILKSLKKKDFSGFQKKGHINIQKVWYFIPIVFSNIILPLNLLRYGHHVRML